MYYNQKVMGLEQIRENVQKLCGLAPGKPVVVGVSGGPDSLCLLDSLARLDYPVVAVHLDHGLRPDSNRDVETVRNAACKIGIPFVFERRDVADYASRARLSIEEAARQVRYRFLFDQARKLSAQAVAVGHTADDQVETLLLHLLRGSGISGLKGMAFRSILPGWDVSIPLVRPLLATWRSETLAYCQERGLEPVFDPTNQDTAILRNRLRHELLPLLETYQPGIRQVLWRSMQVLAGEEAVIQAAVQQAWDSCLDAEHLDPSADSAPCIALRREAFLGLAPGLKRAVLRHAVGRLRAGAPELDFAAIERGVQWAVESAAGQVDLVGGLRLVGEGSLLWVAEPGPIPADPSWPVFPLESIDLPIPGRAEFPTGWVITSTWEAPTLLRPEEISAWEAWLDGESLAGVLTIRRARPGDRFQPLGLRGRSQKLSDFWINAKLPRRARAAWPVVVRGEAIVWVPGFRLSEEYKIKPQTKRALHLRLIRG